MDIVFLNNEINEISFYISPDGEVSPEDQIDKNLRKLKGFLWRENEKPETIEDLFKINDVKQLMNPGNPNLKE